MRKIILVVFNKFYQVPKWNNNVIYTETNKLKKNILYRDLPAVFISNMRLLYSIKNKNKK